MFEAENTRFPRVRLKRFSAADGTESANAINDFTKELLSAEPLKLAAREMA